MDSARLNVGVVGGLGLMASPMARHWRDAEPVEVLRVHDRGNPGEFKDKCRKAWSDSGAELVHTLSELVGDGDLGGVFVCCGKNGDDLPVISELTELLSRNSPNAFICHMSTVSPAFVRSADEYCSRKGVRYVNYPLTGGALGAENATMLILASGDRAVFEELQPSLSLLGKPRFFDDGITAASKVKLIGQVMVFNGLIGICSAAALHSVGLNDGEVGGEKQGEFFDFLNAGAGGTRHWDLILSSGVKRDVWDAPFFARYAVVDAIYAAQLCIDEQVSWLAVEPMLNAALVFSYLVNCVDRNLASHAILKEMVAERAKELDQFLLANAAPRGDGRSALRNCVDTLPDDIKRTVLLDMETEMFQARIVSELA
ncbi:MAG: hypothetical protein K2Z81_19950 [Cyanobacteria bacterium]|nr:hypothetical protein [Cyanobacteriota bacterium]